VAVSGVRVLEGLPLLKLLILLISQRGERAGGESAPVWAVPVQVVARHEARSRAWLSQPTPSAVWCYDIGWGSRHAVR